MGLGIMELIGKEKLQNIKQRIKNTILEQQVLSSSEESSIPMKLTWALLPQNKKDPSGTAFGVNESGCSIEEVANIWAKAFGFNRAVSCEGETVSKPQTQQIYYLPKKMSSIKEAQYSFWVTNQKYPLVRNITAI